MMALLLHSICKKIKDNTPSGLKKAERKSIKVLGKKVSGKKVSGKKV